MERLIAALLLPIAEAFAYDQLEEDDRHALNAKRIKEGLKPIKEPTLLGMVGGILLVFLFCGLVAGIVGGIGAMLVDLLFLSNSFGYVAQWGIAAFLVGLIGFGLMSAIGDFVVWTGKRKAARNDRK